MPNNIRSELQEFVSAMKAIFRDELKQVVVYGSYARGDYNAQSDVDVMLLVGLPDDEIKKLENQVYDCAFGLELKYGISISPIIKNLEFFEYWSDTLPFYKNVKREGVEVA